MCACSATCRPEDCSINGNQTKRVGLVQSGHHHHHHLLHLTMIWQINVHLANSHKHPLPHLWNKYAKHVMKQSKNTVKPALNGTSI